MKIRGGEMRFRITMALLAACGMCGRPAQSFAQAQPEEIASQPVTIKLDAVNSKVKAGSAVWVKIQLTNGSNRDLILGGTNGRDVDPGLQYFCLDESGHDMSRDTSFVSGVGDHPVTTVRSGDSHEELVSLDHACALRKPGTYTIQVSKTDLEDPKRSTAKSNRITITVTP